MKKAKMIYFGLLLITVFIVSTMYFSYAFFTSINEEHGKLNIVAGALDYKIESSDLENNQITVPANTTKEITIKLTSLNDINSKYELYYVMNSGLNVDVGYNSNTTDLPSGEIEASGTKEVTISVRNNTSSNQNIDFGVKGGLTNNELVLTQGKSILEFKIYAENILNGATPVLTDNLIPVEIANDGTVTKANLYNKWYSYEEKRWANAVVLKESYDENKIYDLSGNGYDATLLNGLSIEKDENGQLALNFDGTDDYAELPTLPASINWQDGFTIEFEANWHAINIFSRILDFGNGTGDNIIVYNYSNTNTLAYNYFTDTFTQNVTLVEDIVATSKKEKYKITTSKVDNGYDVVIYKNDKVISSSTIESSYIENKDRINNYLGKSNFNDDEYFKGQIYNLKITQSDGNVILWYDFSINENEVVEEEQIESYFVWIPKYSYQLWDLGNYSTLTTIDSTKPHAIPIKFGLSNTSDSVAGQCATPMSDDGTQGVAGASGNCKAGDYMTHPAFLAFDSNGFWVGKFETGYDGAATTIEAEVDSSDSNKIIIKPNVYSWRNLTLGNMFKASYDYLRNDESHMMKNTEWGAVAYLSHSVYGINDEIRINNNSNTESSFLTGYSAINEPTCGYGDDFECHTYGNLLSITQPYNTEVGYLASTTKNISGVYDMSGGAWDYTAGYSINSNTDGASSGITSVYSDFFTNSSWDKYYDKYSSTASINYNNRILGDATGELGPFYVDGNDPNSSWYKDWGYFLETTRSWFVRGACGNSGIDAGQFTFFGYIGIGYTYASFRIVLTPTK